MKKHLVLSLIIVASLICISGYAKNKKQPNIVIFFLDDSGWGDFSPFADTKYDTPNVQKLAEEGCCYTNFYVPQGVCSASRSALLTGCYPGRTKVFGAIRPEARGLDPKFETMAEMYQKAGYKTGIFGKWHIGDQPDTRPAARGFDESAGLMHSNDMWHLNKSNPKHWGQWPLQYYVNNEVTIEQMTPEYQKQLTTWSKEQSVDFVERHQDEPFFMYVPFSMPHIPLYCSDKFEGKSGQGIYADVMMELDWAVGETLKKIKETGNEKNTIVIFTSDNGPWTVYGKHGGVTPFREHKTSAFDGGIKSACIIKYPKEIKKNTVVEQAFCSVDLMPSLAEWTGVALPNNEIDGLSVTDIITGKKGAKNPHEYYPISTVKKLESILSADGKWKLHLPHSYYSVLIPGENGYAGTKQNKKLELTLYNLENDPYEKNNVIDQYPEIAKRLQNIAIEHKAKFYE